MCFVAMENQFIKHIIENNMFNHVLIFFGDGKTKATLSAFRLPTLRGSGLRRYEKRIELVGELAPPF